MTLVPGFRSNDLTPKSVLVDGQLTVQNDSVLMASGQSSSITPSFRHPPGTVLGYDAGTGKWYLADNSLVDADTRPSITSSGHSDTLGLIRIVGNHGTIDVTTTTGTGTEANTVTDLNADEVFNSHYVASVVGTDVKIEAINGGEEEWFYIDSATADGFGFAEGQANEVKGTSGNFVVTADFVDLQDLDGVATDAYVPAYWRGHFDESELTKLTARAKSVLLARGSKFS